MGNKVIFCECYQLTKVSRDTYETKFTRDGTSYLATYRGPVSHVYPLEGIFKIEKVGKINQSTSGETTQNDLCCERAASLTMVICTPGH